MSHYSYDNGLPLQPATAYTPYGYTPSRDTPSRFQPSRAQDSVNPRSGSQPDEYEEEEDQRPRVDLPTAHRLGPCTAHWRSVEFSLPSVLGHSSKSSGVAPMSVQLRQQIQTGKTETTQTDLTQLISRYCDELSGQVAETVISARPDDDPVLIATFGSTEAAADILKDAPTVREPVERFIKYTMKTISEKCDFWREPVDLYLEILSNMETEVATVGSGMTQAHVILPPQDHGGGVLPGIPESSAQGSGSGLSVPSCQYYSSLIDPPLFPAEYQKRLRKAELSNCTPVAERLAATASRLLLTEPEDLPFRSLCAGQNEADETATKSTFISEWRKKDWTKVQAKAESALTSAFHKALKDRTESRYGLGRCGIGSMDNINVRMFVNPYAIKTIHGRLGRGDRQGLGWDAIGFSLGSNDGYINYRTADSMVVHLGEAMKLNDRSFKKQSGESVDSRYGAET